MRDDTTYESPFPLAPRRIRSSAWAKFTARLAYGYMRVSTTDQNCDPQRHAIQTYYDAFMTDRGYNWGGWYEEVGVSGKVPLRSRPEGFRLSQVVEAGDAVIFAKLDRGFRNRTDCLATVDAWRERGVSVVILDLGNGMDTSTPQGEAMLGMLATFAQMERRLISTRTREAFLARRRKGQPWGTPPYGYLHVGQYIVPDVQLRADVRKIMEWKAEGHSEVRIYFHLLVNKIIRSQTGRPWTQQTINNCCQREAALTQAEAERNFPTPELPPATFAHLPPPPRRWGK